MCIRDSIYTGTVLRILTVTALILSLSGMSIVDKASDDTTLFLVDVSDSTSGQSKAKMCLRDSLKHTRTKAWR